LIPEISKAEGQEGLDIIIKTLYFLVIFFGWFLVTSVVILIIKIINKLWITDKIKKRVWIITGVISLIFWSLTKYVPFSDKYPVELIFENETYNIPERAKDGQVEYDFRNNTVYVWKQGSKEVLREMTVDEIENRKIDEALTKEKLNE
jgi:hypothetical protein